MDNGHDRAFLEKIAREYKPPEVKNKYKTKSLMPKIIETLTKTRKPLKTCLIFFPSVDLNEEENKPYVVMTYLPDGIYHQMRRACKRAGVQLINCKKAGVQLITKPILCAPNRTPQ